MNVFTVFCQQADGRGTIWIDTVKCTDDDAQQAAQLGREECAKSWGYSQEDVHVLGVLRGDADVVFWEDIEED